MYALTDFKTKTALKAAVVAHKIGRGEPVTIYSPGPFPAPENGRTTLEGPHYPKPHTWYASVELKDGVVVSVK